jgi:hypothetical protein
VPVAPPPAVVVGQVPLVAPSGSASAAPSANLLQSASATLAVSTVVDNPRDYAEHLIDGKMDTAWNGKTGQLVGGWIAFRVDDDAHVDAIEMTVGFNKRKDGLDLFTANHRIKRVRILKNQAALKEFTFEIAQRGMQTIPIQSSGGEYKVEVLETVAGTKLEWRELVVSEFRVLGRPGKARRKAEQPLRVSVGALNAAPPDIDTLEVATVSSAFADVATYCAAALEASRPAFEDSLAWLETELARHQRNEFSLYDKADLDKWKATSLSCKEVPFTGTFSGDRTWLAVRAVRIGYHSFSQRRLLVGTARGLVPVPITWKTAVESANPTGCPSAEPQSDAVDVPEVRAQGQRLLAFIDYEETDFADLYCPPTATSCDPYLVRKRGLSWCETTQTGVECKRYDPAFGGIPLAIRKRNRGDSHPVKPWSTVPWTHERNFTIDDRAIHVLEEKK